MKYNINRKDLTEWQEKTYQVYALIRLGGKNLKLWVSCNSVYRVEWGHTILYKGREMHKAIEAWNNFKEEEVKQNG